MLLVFSLLLVVGCHAGFLAREGPPVGPAPPAPKYSAEDYEWLQWHYVLEDKAWPYVGDPLYMAQFPEKSNKWYNCYAVFPHAKPNRMHGVLGLHPENGTSAWERIPKPVAIDDKNREELLKKGGGFYLEMSDYLPLDRDPADVRPNVCKNQVYNMTDLNDASVVITFYNEPMSTLMRSVHAVLNRTPPPLLREIILVDDHSNKTDLLPGGRLYQYVRLLPKVKVLRMPERRGLVMARLAGAVVARAPVLVVLDSHIEVNDGWLEPQLKRLREEPESIVFPQIAGINAETFDHQKHEGIGCRVSFKWVMQEKSQGMIYPDSADAIPSSSMAGGLFAVNRDWFWELGGYDEEFAMWGAENVEMPFRAWMCGGRVECTPCAITYHIYRKGGVGYKSPPEAIWKNRLRTARIWTDEYFQLTQKLIDKPGFDIGQLDNMLLLKERLHCKNFKWFLDNVDTVQSFRSMQGLDVTGEIRNRKLKTRCVDSLGHHREKEAWGTYGCHGEGGTQGFFHSVDDLLLRSFLDESICLGDDFLLRRCKDDNNSLKWEVKDGKFMNKHSGKCLGVKDNNLQMLSCDDPDNAGNILWDYKPFQDAPEFSLPTISPQKREWLAISH